MQKVRDACAAVMQEAVHVHINYGMLGSYARGLLDKYPLTTTLGAENHFLSDNAEETARYVLALDSLNFGSGYFRQARDEGVSFSYTVFAKGLKDAFRNGEMNAPEKWTEVESADFCRMFNISAGANASIDTLFGLFVPHLQETGRRVVEGYQGKAMNFVEAANGSAEAMAETLSQWPTFTDCAEYKGRTVPILKRAQIMPADLHLAGVASFSDMDALTIFADNRVPHVLRCDGALTYTEALAGKIDALVPLPSGSAEEVELRAASIHAVEFMKAASGRNVTSVNIDHILWHRGAEPEIHTRPTHRTMGVWY